MGQVPRRRLEMIRKKDVWDESAKAGREGHWRHQQLLNEDAEIENARFPFSWKYGCRILLHKFLRFISSGAAECWHRQLRGYIVWLTRLCVKIPVVVWYFTEEGGWGGFWHEMFIGQYVKILLIAIKKVSKRIALFVKYWVAVDVLVKGVHQQLFW